MTQPAHTRPAHTAPSPYAPYSSSPPEYTPSAPPETPSGPQEGARARPRAKRSSTQHFSMTVLRSKVGIFLARTISTADALLGKLQNLTAKIWAKAKPIFLFLLGLTLFLCSPPLFVIGFCAGIIFKKEINEREEEMLRVWNKYKPMLIAGAIATCYFAPPFAIWASSCTFAVKLGTHCSLKANTSGDTV